MFLKLVKMETYLQIHKMYATRLTCAILEYNTILYPTHQPNMLKTISITTNAEQHVLL